MKEIFERDGSEIAAEGLRRIAELYRIEAETRSMGHGQRLSSGSSGGIRPDCPAGTGAFGTPEACARAVWFRTARSCPCQSVKIPRCGPPKPPFGRDCLFRWNN
ncbi:hypothetical protein [Paracoccus pantotrophus]|uniref:hypothetical protein n=1 Tax=Paracoccus pantotrophus TaxID=82367 RepID=UPI001E319F2B|nr:hypothetical protein [Paracoccus pantotrophus]